MLDIINKKSISELAEVPGPCVSLLLPTAHLGRDRLEARIRLKNEIVKAEDLLTEKGMRRTLAKDLLEPARNMMEDPNFWMTQEDGLAVYVAPGVFRVFRLPIHLPYSISVSEEFNLRPLIALNSHETFYILALDEESSRLLRVQDHRVKEVTVEGMPSKLMALAAVEHHEKERQMHAAGRVGRAGSLITHGSGEHADEKDQIRRYCQAVDRAICRFLAKSSAPMLIAADEPIRDIYPKITHYPHFLKERIAGSPRRATPEELLEKAWEVVRPQALERRKAATLRYAEMAGTSLTSNRIDEIAKEAAVGRVDVLVADPSMTTASDGDDLVNRAAIATFKNGGTYLECAPGELGEDAAIAIYRN